jgi:hypothetical protein
VLETFSTRRKKGALPILAPLNPLRRRVAILLGLMFCGMLAMPSGSSLPGLASASVAAQAGKPAFARQSGLTTTRYTPSTENIVNPERGFYHQSTLCDSKPFVREKLAAYRLEQISLVRCIFYLREFKTTNDIGGAVERFRHQVQTARAAGVKLVVRFAYTDADMDEAGFGQDASPTLVQEHLTQLAPLLTEYSDVIAWVESGFVGAWGEGAYSENFGGLTGAPLTPQNLADRKAVVERLLSILPADRKVLVRTPEMKRTMYGNNPTSSADIAAGAAKARVGFYNDCFLASNSDFGTYHAPDDRTYLANDTRYVPMGGETCGKNANPPRSNCPTALKELGQFHWSYLNLDFSEAVLDTWRDDGCMAEVERRLGYRFRLISVGSSTTVKQGANMALRVTMRNTGWAAAVNRRPLWLILRKASPTKAVYRFYLGTAENWQAGATLIRSCLLSIPPRLAVGTYQLLLSLPDAAPSLASRPEYAVQLANAGGLWEPSAGLNRLLRAVTVQRRAGGSDLPSTPSPPPTCSDRASKDIG